MSNFHLIPVLLAVFVVVSEFLSEQGALLGAVAVLDVPVAVPAVVVVIAEFFLLRELLFLLPLVARLSAGQTAHL